MKGVFVIGAGPAGMFAARRVALAGYDVCVFNRDIRPGGLAQYGIYPLKLKMKSGLRKQFEQTLALPNVHYFGHVQIGASYDVSLAELEQLKPAAIIFASGAQGAKKLGLPGENAYGIYAAKDFVYHYNQLESHTTKDFSTYRHIAVVGVGNVAIDVARWLLQDKPARHTQCVTVIARRGPLDVKFDTKEIENVEPHIDRAELVAELERVRARCEKAGQDAAPETVIATRFPHLNAPGLARKQPRLRFRFLASPKAFVPDQEGRVRQLVISENELVSNSDGGVSARATGETAALDVDTVLFAIGDRHDPEIGLPMGPEGYAIKPGEEPGTLSYEVWDPATKQVHPGRFVVGWARRASTGLAGLARHDGEAGADRALAYLQDTSDTGTATAAEVREYLEGKGIRVVDKEDVALLARAEERLGRIDVPNSFHIIEEEAMLQAIDEERRQEESELSARDTNY